MSIYTSAIRGFCFTISGFGSAGLICDILNKNEKNDPMRCTKSYLISGIPASFIIASILLP